MCDVRSLPASCRPRSQCATEAVIRSRAGRSFDFVPASEMGPPSQQCQLENLLLPPPTIDRVSDVCGRRCRRLYLPELGACYAEAFLTRKSGLAGSNKLRAR